MNDSSFLETLQGLIRERLRDTPEDSYTAKLAQRGVLAVAQKVGEEGVEVALAGIAQEDEQLIGESADLLFHLLILLELRELPIAAVIGELEQRHRARTAR
jgi:phosphoribosyl-ATP pyrophosphohydrolase/phosphoribosyl-AMP cyclohydrolase